MSRVAHTMAMSESRDGDPDYRPGSVQEEEVNSLLRHYRYKKIETVFDRLDVGGNGSISFAEFLTQVDNLKAADEVQNARISFDMLGPDKDGNVRKRKYIQLQIAAFEDVLDAEFDRWVHIMTKGNVVHAHRKHELRAAGVDIPEDYIEPPLFSLKDWTKRVLRFCGSKVHRLLFAAQERQHFAAFELSANARKKHIARIQAMQEQLDEHDKTLLDDEHMLAITALQTKTKARGTQQAPKQRKLKKKIRKDQGKGVRVKEGFDGCLREEKENEEGPLRGLKIGNEIPPLKIENTESRLRQARLIQKRIRDERLATELGGTQKKEQEDDDDDDDDDKLNYEKETMDQGEEE